ncbi:Ankyrin repeat and SOCS box [Elasticomyces elasticus]|nr:Ankyrin repeat and SOCS box [Elasticomyces elasticus]
MPSSSIRPAELHAGGLRPIDEEDRMQPSAQSSEDENTAAEHNHVLSANDVDKNSRRNDPLQGTNSGPKGVQMLDLIVVPHRADATRKRRKLQRIDPDAAIRNDRRTEVPSSALDQYGTLSDVNSTTVSRGMHEPGHASLVGELAHELDETGHLDLMRGSDPASGEDFGSRSRSSSSEGHDSGIELQPGIPEAGLASPYKNSGTDHAPAAGFFVPLASVAESVPLQATMDEAMKQDGVDILQYDWQRDPEKYLLINLDELVGTQVISLHGDEAMIWQYERDDTHERPTTSTSDAVIVIWTNFVQQKQFLHATSARSVFLANLIWIGIYTARRRVNPVNAVAVLQAMNNRVKAIVVDSTSSTIGPAMVIILLAMMVWRGLTAHEAGTVELLRSFKSAFDNLSLPELRRRSGVSWISKISKTSKFSGRSEPIGHAFDMQELQGRLDRMDLDGLPAQLRRNARRLAGTQKEVDDQLLNAVSISNIDAALSLLRRGARSGAALSVAVARDNDVMIGMLLGAGASVDLGMLYTTVSSGQATAVKQLLGNRGHNFAESHGTILLQLAIRLADLDTLLALLSCGVEVDQKPSGDQLLEYASYADPRESGWSTMNYPAYHALTGDPPLCVAAYLGHEWAIACLLGAGATPDAEGVEGTALGGLTDAVEDVEIIEVLAGCGFDADICDTHGHTPLYRACQQNRTMAMEALLQAGASPTCRALHVAVPRRTPGSRECIQILVAAGADLDQLDEQGCPPLKLAALHLHAEAFEQLIDAGADINGFSISDLHELMFRRPVVSVAPLLGVMLAHDYPILDFKSADGKSILHRAAANGDVESITCIGDRELLYRPSPVMSATVIDVLHFELTSGKYDPELDIGSVRLEGSLSTHYDVCEALLRSQPPGLALDFSTRVITAILQYGFVELEPAISTSFVELLLQKCCSKLTPQLTAELVIHAIQYSSGTDPSTVRTILLLLNCCEKALPPELTMDALTEMLEGSGDWLQEEIEVLLLRQCEDKAELSRLCNELPRLSLLSRAKTKLELGSSSKVELKRRDVLARAMARAGFEVPKWKA